MNEEEFARALLAHERKEWQNPDKILAQIGIKPGMTVADLACGPGFFTVPIARVVGSSGRVYAVDSSKVMLEYLRSNMNRSHIGETMVEIVESDVTNSPIPSGTADIVLFVNILHDLGSQKEFLKEVKRISKNSGLAVDIDWKKVENDFGPPLEIRLSEDAAREILAESGYNVIKRIDAGPFHYGLICNILNSVQPPMP
jgi:ubiquinone/menaquinone biosynthesis C-methylase UbiE